MLLCLQALLGDHGPSESGHAGGSPTSVCWWLGTSPHAAGPDRTSQTPILTQLLAARRGSPLVCASTSSISTQKSSRETGPSADRRCGAAFGVCSSLSGLSGLAASGSCPSPWLAVSWSSAGLQVQRGLGLQGAPIAGDQGGWEITVPRAAMCPHRAAPSPANTGCAAARHHPNPHMLSQAHSPVALGGCLEEPGRVLDVGPHLWVDGVHELLILARERGCCIGSAWNSLRSVVPQ